MTENTEFKTLENGSIDYGHYMARGRVLRSGAFHSALRMGRPSLAAKVMLWVKRLGAGAIASIKPAQRGAAFHPGE